MRAATVREPSDGYVDIKDVELRPIKANEALVDIEYCGLCLSLIHISEPTRRTQ